MCFEEYLIILILSWLQFDRYPVVIVDGMDGAFLVVESIKKGLNAECRITTNHSNEEEIDLQKVLVKLIDNFHFLHGFVTILMDSAILLYGVLPWLWKKSSDTLESIGFDSNNEIYHTLAFLAGVMIWSQQTILLFFRDMIKGMFLAVVIGPPVVVAIILIVQGTKSEGSGVSRCFYKQCFTILKEIWINCNMTCRRQN
ncbi:uncharacterized protein LOC111901216 isoform X1 [Lactuca sativa]|uniref:uncharacterized protein LOC111901216 isoform X1 n=1 Tax=Lactuca sativa TaxID=4236 RepID=UPI0022B05907|nr:uncharacterized protein LOC111901216 isoform X1 [Lactuca sativa]